MQIYKITNTINNKIYIGKDTKSDINYFGSGLLINRAIMKYGRENFIKEIIDETDDYEELSLKEIYWIDKYKSFNREIGYNITKGGDGGDTISNHPDIDIIRDKISKNNPKKGKKYEDVFGEEKSKIYKEKLKQKIHKNILSPQSKLKNQNNWIEYNNKFKERCEFIKSEIDNGNIDEFLDELKLIKKRVYHNFLKSANGFYQFFGYKIKFKLCESKIDREEEFNNIKIHIESKNIQPIINYIKKSIPNIIFKNRLEFYEYIGYDLKEMIIKELKSKRKERPLKNEKISIKNETKKIKISIDDIKYDSISDASIKLNIHRKTICYRLESPNFKNYTFQDEEMNKKYKYSKGVSKRKEPISIKGKKYESITEASTELNKSISCITWRLNSKYYTDWIYINKKVELKETGEPKMKKVSILGNQYDSISDAVIKSGIDRQIMRYRIRSKNYPDYFYI